MFMPNAEIEPPSVAQLMDPGSDKNQIDFSGRGVNWDPAVVLSAAEDRPIQDKSGNQQS